MKKRLFTLFLAIILVVGIVPMAAGAYTPTPGATYRESLSAGTPFPLPIERTVTTFATGSNHYWVALIST